MQAKIKEYIDFWTSPAPKPRSIRWLEKFLAFTNWRPSEDDAFLVSHQLMDDESKYYEDLLRDYDPDVTTTWLDEDKFDVAQESEIRNRIFKAIYQGNLYDDLMPIEARHFTLSSERKAKLSITAFLFCLLYCVGFFMPSVFYGVASNSSAIYATSNSELAGYVSGELADSYYLLLETQGETPPSLLIDKNIPLLPQVQDFRATVALDVQSHGSELSGLVAGQLWASSPVSAQTNAVSDAVFLQGLIADEEAFREFNDNFKLLVTPGSNLLELITQLTLLVWTVVLLNWFLSKKSQFYDAFEGLPSKFRMVSLKLLEETLMSNFFYRKKFHYLLAFAASAAAILVHYATIDMHFNKTSAPVAALLDLRPVDYRISSVSGPIVILNWALQFILGYTLLLVCWELRLLHESLKIWQAKVLHLKFMDAKGFDKLFTKMAKDQRRDWLLLGVVVCCFLIMVCAAKVYVQPVLPQGQLALVGSPSGQQAAPLDMVWSFWSLGYTFAPVALVMFLIALIWAACAPTSKAIRSFQVRKGIDVHAAFNFVANEAKKVTTIRKAWDEVYDLFKAEDADNNQGIQSGSPQLGGGQDDR